MGNSDQDRRQRRAWEMIRLGSAGRGGVAGARDGALKAGPPAFIAGGEGELVAARVAGEVGAVFRAHGKTFPKARLRAVLEAGDDVRKDSALVAWATAFGEALGAVLEGAARASFRRGVNDVAAKDGTEKRVAREFFRGAWASSEVEARIEKAADEEVQRAIQRVWNLLKEGLEEGLSPEEIVDRVDQYIWDHNGRRARTIAWTVVLRWWHEGRHWEYTRAGASHKIWHTSPYVDNCPICVANVDAGEIEIKRVFPSGHQHPLAHPWCHCWLEYTGLSERGYARFRT